MIRAVLIELDGALIDSGDAHAMAWVEAFRSEKVAATLARVRRLVGMPSAQVIPILCGARAESEVGARIIARQEHLFVRDHLSSLRPMPGARELLVRLRREGVKIAVTTSTSERVAHELLKRARASDLVDAVVIARAPATEASSAASSAASPAASSAATSVTTGIQALGVSHREAVVIADSPYNVEAAVKEGVRAVGLLCGGWAAETFKGATALYRDPADLVQRFELSMFSSQRRAGTDVPFPIS